MTLTVCCLLSACSKKDNAPHPVQPPAQIYASVPGWPAEYEGVMLQGFFWDSFNETSWQQLSAQVSDLAPYFKLVWIPQSGKAKNTRSMGYDVLYWYNQNSSFGTESELKNLIKTFNAQGIGTIADVVINHRETLTTWIDFPSETYQGVTHSMTSQDIARDDEALAAGYPTGKHLDTGDNWPGMRDLDHLSQHVQTEVIAYLKFLKNDLGYAGFRYDLVKGYQARFTKLYNQASSVQYSVGECFDGSYDVVKKWLDGTKDDKGVIQSAAFDFPGKFALNQACNNGKWNEIMWRRHHKLAQPAGLIHMDTLQRYAVTFVDNHDTFRNHDAITTNITAANAFILSMPGTPCVFYPHWRDYKSEIQALIKARQSVRIHNQSPVVVLESNASGYVAEVTGKSGKLLVKVGPMAYTAPADYTLKASGTNYAVWTK